MIATDSTHQVRFRFASDSKKATRSTPQTPIGTDEIQGTSMTTDQQPTSLPPSGAALPTSVERTNLTASRTWALIDNQISPEELEKLSADLSKSPEARRA